MGGACCKCYSETPTTTNESRVEQELEQSKPPMHDMQGMQSIPSTSAPPIGIAKDTSTDTTLPNGLKDRTKSIEIEPNDPTRLRLIEFYKLHHKERVKDSARIDEVVRRYKGREAQLFEDLERKYNVNKSKRIPANIGTQETEKMRTTKTGDHGSPSVSNKKVKRELVEDDSEHELDIAMSPMLNDHSSTEQKPIVSSTMTITLNSSKEEKMVQLSAQHKDLFKIEVTKPHKFKKKKKKKTATFGAGGGDKIRKAGTMVERPGLQTPTAFASLTRSNTLTLDSHTKASLDKRRQSSLAVRRNQQQRNLPIRINKVWAIFAAYVVDKMLKEKKEAAKEEEEVVAPEDMLDSIINSDKNDRNNKKTFSEDVVVEEEKSALEVLSIDPRLFEDAATRSSISSSAASSSGSSSDADLMIDVYSLSITNSQFNIVLNNASIQISPDMSCALIWCLLDLNGLIPEDIMSLGNSSDNLHNDPMKERGFHSKQFKLISKCRITYKHIEYLMQRLASGALVTRNDKSLHPRHLSYSARNYVIWDKMFEHLMNGTSFNVEEDYLFGTLGEEELSDSSRVTEMLSSLDSHWQHRVQLMEHIDDKLNSASEMERDIFFASILAENDNFLRILRGWAIQLTDDRSGVARTAVTTLCTVLQGLLLCIQFPLIIFECEEEEEVDLLNVIYDGIFCLVKNRRLKDMADDAYDTMCSLTDILAEITQINDEENDYQYMAKIVGVLENHSNPKCEKHERAREACIGGVAFLLYGVADLNIDLSNPGDAAAAAVVEEDKTGQALGSSPKSETKLSRNMQRKYLLQNEAFVASFGNILKCGVTDKSESARKKAFNLLQRLEDDDNLNNLSSKWDYTVIKKFTNWKKLSLRKTSRARGRSSSKNRNRSTSKNMRKKMKKKNKAKKNKKFSKSANDLGAVSSDADQASPSISPSPSPSPQPPQPSQQLEPPKND
eukprot:520100_1